MKPLITISFILLLFSCEKDQPIEGSASPTPVELVTPQHLGEGNGVPEDNPLTEEGIDLGRHLFYETMLSRDSTLSCGSCHKQQFAFTDGLPTSIGVGNQIVSRNSMPTVNLIYVDDLFWDGRAATIEEQALGPIENSMEMDLSIKEAVSRLKNSAFYVQKFLAAFPSEKDTINADLLAKAIAQFERTILSGNSKYDLYKQGLATFTEQEERGELLFYTHPYPGALRGGNCGDCHSGILQSDGQFRNNGLDKIPSDKGLEDITENPMDRGKFRTVSLRNIELTGPYMHDGRFETLEDVLEQYNEHVQSSFSIDPNMIVSNEKDQAPLLKLTDQEIKDIIAFLKTLTDEDLISNPAFSNPFEK